MGWKHNLCFFCQANTNTFSYETYLLLNLHRVIQQKWVVPTLLKIWGLFGRGEAEGRQRVIMTLLALLLQLGQGPFPTHRGHWTPLWARRRDGQAIATFHCINDLLFVLILCNLLWEFCQLKIKKNTDFVLFPHQCPFSSLKKLYPLCLHFQEKIFLFILRVAGMKTSYQLQFFSFHFKNELNEGGDESCLLCVPSQNDYCIEWLCNRMWSSSSAVFIRVW